MSTKEHRAKELAFLNTLQHLSSLCRRYETRSLSMLDPMRVVADEIRAVSDASIQIFSMHMELFRYLSGGSDIAAFLDRLFSECRVLKNYELLLSKSIDIILNPSIAVFRSGDFSFVRDILKIYGRLLHYLSLIGKLKPEPSMGTNFDELQRVITNFENQFLAKYTLINNNSLVFEPVPSLQYNTLDLLSPDRFNIFDIKNRSFFDITILKHGYNDVLVELITLQDGKLAIFKVNTGELPHCSKINKDILSNLLEGDYTLLNVGRTIMYLPIEPYALDVKSFLNNGVILETKLRSNNVEIKLVCLDHDVWKETWKPNFESNFKSENLVHAGISRETVRQSIIRNSKIFENGLSISPGQRKSQPRTPIRKSKAISSRMSLLLDSTEESDKLEEIFTPISGNSSPTPVSALDCYATLTKSYNLDLSPTELRLSRVTYSVKIQNNDSFNTSGFDVSRAESFSSGKLSVSPVALFDSPPELYNSISSELSTSSNSSVFSVNGNHESKGVSSRSVACPTLNATELAVLPNSLSGSPQNPQTEALCTARDSAPLFEYDSARVSLWGGTGWVQLGDTASNIRIEQLSNGKLVLLSNCNDIYGLKVSMSTSWKCLRSTSNDIHIKIPHSDIISIMPDMTLASVVTISIRHPQVEQLMDIILQCTATTKVKRPAVRNSLPAANFLTSGGGSRKSLIHSKDEQSLNSNVRPTEESVSSSTLLSNIRVKRHTRVGGKLWESQDMGYLNILSRERRKVKVGIDFQYEKDDYNSPSSKLDFVAVLKGIKRIGRTGITFSGGVEEELFEFSNKSVADHVFSVIHS